MVWECLWKMHCSQLLTQYRLLQSYLSDLGGVVRGCEEEECVVEALGILANLSLPDVDFERVLRELDLLPFILSKVKVLY